MALHMLCFTAQEKPGYERGVAVAGAKCRGPALASYAATAARRRLRATQLRRRDFRRAERGLWRLRARSG